MTVGIAAMCYWGGTSMIVGASDRMITSGDTEFEPDRTKIYSLTNSIVMLIAGDTAAQTDIRYGALKMIGLRLAQDQSWMQVEEVAELVSRVTVQFHRRLAQRTVLEPLGLTFDSFITRQSELQPSVLSELLRRIDGVRPSIETIIAGVDETGAHVYEIYASGHWRCVDAAGFSAIGGGSRHAESQFMFAGHSGVRQFPETQFLTYTAKRRAEVAPGVGAATDMFVVFGLGRYSPLQNEEVKRLSELYQAMKEMQEAAVAKAEIEAQSHFKKILQQLSEETRTSNEQQPPALEEEPPQTPPSAKSEPLSDSPNGTA